METVYIKTKNGNILECYVSEQMNKPIYYPIESKTNGYVDYYDVERFLGIDGMYREVKQLQQDLSIANDKLKRIKELIKTNVKDDWSIVETCLVWEIEKIIKGDD